MLEIEREKGIHFVSDDFSHIFQDENWSPYALKHADYLQQALVRRRLFQEAIKKWGELHHLDGYILLEAHGANDEHQWQFVDGLVTTPIQSWVDEKDGQANSLIIFSCNPHNFDLVSRDSILVYLTQVTNLPNALRYGYSRMYIPGLGHFDKNYSALRKAINKLAALG